MSTIRARVRNGKLEPVEKLSLPEGTMVELIIVSSPKSDHRSDLEAFRSSFGGWKGIFDPEAFLAGLRQPLTRPEPKL